MTQSISPMITLTLSSDNHVSVRTSDVVAVECIALGCTIALYLRGIDNPLRLYCSKKEIYDTIRVQFASAGLL